ncbi:MAG: hypothetical protein AAB649_07825, partial [Patescibacteria group bacterium]
RNIARYGLGVLRKIPLAVYASLVAYLIIVLGIHLLTRPYLWLDPVGRFQQIIGYYQGIGTGKFYQPSYIIKGWNMYPLIFVIASTPIVILVLACLGIMYGGTTLRRNKNSLYSLLLLWLAVPILRVMWPGSSIYSGVRQIMEYIPAMAVLAGLGALVVRNFLTKISGKASIVSILTLALFLPITFKLWQLHPNENVFLNRLVGGVRGAVDKKIPGSAETMGNVYLQGVRWLNNNAEPNARFGLPVGLLSNIPTEYLRADIRVGSYFSGMKQDGEYMMEMVSVDFPPPRYNFWYLDRFLTPVYTVDVGGVSLLKIWKNDGAHTKEAYRGEVEFPVAAPAGGERDGFVSVQLDTPLRLTRLEVYHDAGLDCAAQTPGTVVISRDGKEQFQMPDDLMNMQGPYAASLQTVNRFVYFFAADRVQTIQIIPSDGRACLLRVRGARAFGLPEA